MQPADLRAYADRRWAVVERLKREHWTREFATHGPEATLQAAHGLSEHMRLLRPDWPSDEERREDLAHHLRLKCAIDRAAGVFAPLAHH